MIIDFHAHITAPEVIARRDKYLERDAWFRELYASPKARLCPVEELVAAMEHAHIDRAVVFGFGWRDMGLCRQDNDYVMDAVTRYPDKLIGFAVVNPGARDEAVGEIERCAAGGLRGVGELMPDGQGFSFDDERTMAPIVEVAMAHDMVLLTHCSEPVGHLYPGKGLVTPDKVIRFAQRFPEVTLVCAHWGGGTVFYELMPEVARIMHHVYYDTAASPLLYQTSPPVGFRVRCSLPPTFLLSLTSESFGRWRQPAYPPPRCDECWVEMPGEFSNWEKADPLYTIGVET